MWCVYDSDENIIAFHDSKKVVEKYVDSVFSIHNILLEIGKIKKDSEYKLQNNDELYLVRYNDTYVQEGYLLYLQIVSDCRCGVEDEEFTRDILFRLLEMNRLNNKEKKVIEKAIKVIDSLLAEDEKFIPTLDQLKSLKLDYDPYIYNYRLGD